MRRAGGEGETGLEAMVSAPQSSDCPRSAPALRGRFFLRGKRRERMLEALTPDGAAQSRRLRRRKAPPGSA